MPSQICDQSCTCASGLQVSFLVSVDSFLIIIIATMEILDQELGSSYRQLIILMMKQGGQDLKADFTMPVDGSPKREEWAIINKYKAIEFQRMKQRQYLIDRQKKQSFKRQLDNQVNSKSNAQQRQKQQDRLYYQHLSELAERDRQKEQAQKNDRFQQRRRVDKDNLQKLEGNRHHYRDGDTGYHLEIGIKSEKQHTEKASKFRKQMMDTLDIQLRQKSEEQKMNKIRNLEMEQAHKKVQDSYFRQEERKHLSQNTNIYHYYEQLERERQMKEKELEHKFVEEARERHERAEHEKELTEMQKKMMTKEIVKETLGLQVKENKRKRIQESTTNPEQLSFRFISGIFEPKYQGYDKQKYKKELQRQAEENRIRRQRQNHMSNEQYKLNMNQLSKAVMGNYAQKDYLDRSLGALGDHEKYKLDEQTAVPDQDAGLIKSRLKQIRKGGAMTTIG